MPSSTLLPDTAELYLDHLISELDSIILVIKTARPAACCPACQHPSTRVHSRYVRSLADLPWSGIRVRLRLHTRRFFCSSPTCSRRIFTERLPATATPYARRTVRFREALQLIGFAVGGQAGARLATRLGLAVSGDTLLRYIRQWRGSDRPTPRVLGVDDWAYRRGQRYGTILVDLEQRAVVDLLPDRSAESLAAWIKSHPGIEVVSRDRAGYYAEGAAQGAPEVVQVADRWHLLRNLSEALQQIVEREPAQLGLAAARASEKQSSATPLSTTGVPPAPVSRPPTRLEQVSRGRRDRRLAHYREVMRLCEAGSTQEEIARKLSLSTRTVRRWEQAGQFPERRMAPPRRQRLDRFLPHLEQCWDAGLQNALAWWREVREQGYRGSRGAVQRWATRQRQITPPEAPKARPVLTTPRPRQATWWLLQEPAEREPEHHEFVCALEQLCPAVAQAAKQAREFVHLLRQRQPDRFSDWLERTKATELRRFATSLQRDESAVRAALALPWSNGQVEGHVHRLKLIKRQMFGRAKFDLLKKRVLYPAA
jgi:transposase